MKVLSQRALEGLRAYKYKPGGYTWLDHVHTPFWNWLTEQLPLWLAPNLITLSGLIAMFIAYFGEWWFLPDFTGEAPRWAYLIAGISILVYTNLDCIDGKQARRTKTSSPLGQLFDHGCDAISLHVMLALVQGALNHPSNMFGSITTMAVNMPWLISHWEEYHTGVLMYGNGYFGVLEANYILALVSLITGMFGPSLWAIRVGKVVPGLPSWAHPDTELKTVFCYIAMIGALGQLYGQLQRVSMFKPEDLSEMERGHKELGLWARIKHLLLCSVVLALGVAWLGDEDLKPGEARLVALGFGLAYSVVATQLIMDHMSKEPFRPPPFAVAVLALASLNSVWEWVDTRTAAAACTSVLLAYYLWYVTTIVNQVCAFLGIKCLTITPKRGE